LRHHEFRKSLFFGIQNIFNVLRNMSTVAIISVGVTMVIITGGIDLSVGSVLAVSAMLSARLMWQGLPPFIAFIAGLLLGLGIGLLNGLIITKIKVNAFITTMGMMSIARGLLITWLQASKERSPRTYPLMSPSSIFWVQVISG